MMSTPKPQTTPYDFDTVSDLIAEGVIHPDDVAAEAGLKMQKETAERANDCYDDPDWEPPYTHVAEDF